MTSEILQSDWTLPNRAPVPRKSTKVPRPSFRVWAGRSGHETTHAHAHARTCTHTHTHLIFSLHELLPEFCGKEQWPLTSPRARTRRNDIVFPFSNSLTYRVERSWQICCLPAAHLLLPNNNLTRVS